MLLCIENPTVEGYLTKIDRFGLVSAFMHVCVRPRVSGCMSLCQHVSVCMLSGAYV